RGRLLKELSVPRVGTVGYFCSASLGDAPMTALLQGTIPNHLQGRGLSLLNMVMGLAAPLGLALTTPLGELIGVRWLFVFTGVLGGLICLMGFFSSAVRRLEDGTHY
ncbi:MFS transporter, partial [Pseudomonas syringae]